MSNYVVINDVGPRDGLQNQSKTLTVQQRIRLINALVNANIANIEVGAFVSPKVVPAMKGCEEILDTLSNVNANLSVLIPNVRGYELAKQAGANTVAMVLYSSEGMARKNVGMSRREADLNAEEIIRRSRIDGIDVFATLSVAFECPFDGATDPDIVCEAASNLLRLGASNVVIADTIGAANPSAVSNLMRLLLADTDPSRLTCHFHDTRALGLANVYAALVEGVRRFDASIAGLGGCPFAPGASGNVATEDVVMMLHEMGYETGVDLAELMIASDLAGELTASDSGGRSKPWLKPHLRKQACA
ncbi:MAG: hydroxymethylglutaryl-CoA lyase [Pseudomonadota bacterium]